VGYLNANCRRGNSLPYDEVHPIEGRRLLARTYWMAASGVLYGSMKTMTGVPAHRSWPRSINRASKRLAGSGHPSELRQDVAAVELDDLVLIGLAAVDVHMAGAGVDHLLNRLNVDVGILADRPESGSPFWDSAAMKRPGGRFERRNAKGNLRLTGKRFGRAVNLRKHVKTRAQVLSAHYSSAVQV